MNVCKLSCRAITNVYTKHFGTPKSSPFKLTGVGAVRNRRAFIGIREPEEEKSLEDRLREEEASVDHMEPVDISLPLPKSARKRFSSEDLKKRRATPTVATTKPTPNLDEVHARWLSESASLHIFLAAQHYQIYEHLLEEAVFQPRVPLVVEYSSDALQQPVHTGNLLQPADMQQEPEVSWPSRDESLWLLLMTSPDAHLSRNDAELLHWAVGNIRGGDVTSGQQLTSYLPPLPPHGAGFHRYVFVLYKQSESIDFASWPQAAGLSGRTFRTRDMYGSLQEQLTPAGLAFCQAQWDPAVREYCHRVLDRAEPVFDYIHPEKYRPPQETVPHKHPFDIYLNMFRDRKDIGEQVLKERLAEIEPLSGRGEEAPRYPALPWLHRDMPTWLQDQVRDRQHKRGIYQLERHRE